jgi:hypothetical protein
VREIGSFEEIADIQDPRFGSAGFSLQAVEERVSNLSTSHRPLDSFIHGAGRGKGYWDRKRGGLASMDFRRMRGMIQLPVHHTLTAPRSEYCLLTSSHRFAARLGSALM